MKIDVADSPKNNTSAQILVVDQERLGSLIAKMLKQGSYESDVAVDGIKALTMLRTLSPDLIVADVDIPGGGIKLAELVGLNPKYQNIPIILMSANPTPDIIIRARNAGCSSYLAKPFRPSELQSRIELALKTPLVPPPATNGESQSSDDAEAPKNQAKTEDAAEEEDDGAANILKRVKSIEGLPSFPSTHAEILTLAKSEDATSDDIAEKMQLDPGLLATIFKLVNSSYYGFNKQVKDLPLAITLLGLEEIANPVLAVQVFEQLGSYENGAGLDLQEFWRHSIGTAFVARAVAKKLNTEVESAFLAGMLHDLGKIILDRYFGEFYGAVFEIINSEDISIAQAEQEVLGLTHAAVGGQLAEEWKFPKTFLNAILYHHQPNSAARYQRLVCIIHIADAICRQIGYGSGGDKQQPDPEDGALDRFSLGERGMAILTEAATEELESADSFLSALKS